MGLCVGEMVAGGVVEFVRRCSWSCEVTWLELRGGVVDDGEVDGVAVVCVWYCNFH